MNDTSPEAERVQIDLLRRKLFAQRLALALSLSQTVADFARRAIRQSMPEANEDQLRVRFVAIHYGEALAERIRARLAQKPP